MPGSARRVMLVLNEKNFVFGEIYRRSTMDEHHMVSEGGFVIKTTTAIFYFANVLICFEVVFLRGGHIVILFYFLGLRRFTRGLSFCSFVVIFHVFDLL